MPVMPPQRPPAISQAEVGNALPARSSSAERVRRHRERRRRGQRNIHLDVRDTEIRWLISHNYLASAERDDPDAIGVALGRLLDEVIR